MKHCEACSVSGVYGCDRCVTGYYVNQLLGMCKSSACLVDFCDSCALSGPSSCDACHEGYRFNRETGLCEDTICKVALCVLNFLPFLLLFTILMSISVSLPWFTGESVGEARRPLWIF